MAEFRAPHGKTRVVGVDPSNDVNWLHGDYIDRNEAFRVADEYNSARSGGMDNIYYVYDDNGYLLRDHEAVGH